MELILCLIIGFAIGTILRFTFYIAVTITKFVFETLFVLLRLLILLVVCTFLHLFSL